MFRWVFGFVMLLAAGLIQAVHSPYYLQVTGPQAGQLTVRFLSFETGENLSPAEVLYPTGFIRVVQQLDQDATEFHQEYLGADRENLQAMTDGLSKALVLPIRLPNMTSSGGKVLNLKIVARDHAGKSLGWTQQLSLVDSVAVNTALGTDLAEQLRHITAPNQLSSEQVDQVIAILSGSPTDNACEIGFLGRSGRLNVNEDHCKLTASPLLGPTQWDDSCRQNSEQFLKDVVIMSESQCHLDAAVASVVGQEQEQGLRKLVVQRWSEIAEAQSSRELDWQGLSAQLALWAPMRANDLKRFSYYVDQIAVQRNASKANQRWFVSQPVFRDTLTSELVRAIVTHHFKSRGAFADWCSQNSSEPSAKDSCFQFATDVSVRLTTIFGFETLPAFNQSVTAHREAYLLWAKSVLGANHAASSLNVLTEWSIQFAEDHFGKSDCSSLLLFPIGRLMVEEWTPDIQLLSDPSAPEYQSFVSQLADQYERFVQALWQALEGDDFDGRRKNPTCAERTVKSTAFAAIVPY